MSDAIYFLSGAACFGFLVAGLFFLRFWHRSHDRLFATFSISFFMMALERILVLRFTPESEIHSMIYLIRLLAFILIMSAVAEKNRASHRRHQSVN